MHNHRINRTATFALGLVLLLLPRLMAAADRFTLHVDEASGLTTPWPMKGGLPFPQGAIRDAGQIRVLRGDVETPSQIDVASRWPDGSIRWALVGLHAVPQGEYRVEFGPGIQRRPPDTPLQVAQAADGGLTVDTGAAVYRFGPDGLLPQRVEVNGVTVLEYSGAAAYLIDNHGRVARVAGASAEIETAILRQGPVRTAIRREGWYVTGDGDRIARAKIWFYFTVGSPFVRMTHSLILTENTNTLWVRDYGLEFNTPAAPREVVFALSEPGVKEDYPGTAGGRGWLSHRGELAELYLSSLTEREQRQFAVTPNGNEVYLLQDRYPHVLERDFRAVIAQTPAGERSEKTGINANNFWAHTWLKRAEVAGDWADGRYDGFGLCVVVPQLAQQFPKEIAFGPGGARVALWSGRSGRELDFRAITLVNEYWQRWAQEYENRVGMGPADVTELVREPSNAQGVARTHDLWLLPRAGDMGVDATARQAAAASHPPLLRADPAWLCATEAIGWPMHPRDPDRFPEVERILEDMWTDLIGSPFANAGLRRTGMTLWGAPPNLRGHRSWFRLSHYTSGDYHLRAHVLPLFARGGDRSLFTYANRYNRWQSDLAMVHWTGGGKRAGEFAIAAPYRNHLPFFWGDDQSHLPADNGRIRNWLHEYYLTGNEHALDTVEMIAEAYRRNWNAARDLRLTVHGHLYVLSGLLAHDGGDARLRQIADEVVDRLVDPDNPTGLSDEVWYGVYYKTTQQLLPLAFYYEATGDARAKAAVLQAMDYKLRFNIQDRTRLGGRRLGLFCQHFGTFLWSKAYQWTGNPDYLRLVNSMMENTLQYQVGQRFGALLNQMNPFSGVPFALHVLAGVDAPIAPYPLMSVRVPERVPSFDAYALGFAIESRESMPPVVFEKEAGRPVTLRITIRIADRLPGDTVAQAVLGGPDGERPEGVRIEHEAFFMTSREDRQDPHRRHVVVKVPADAPAGEYRLTFPDAGAIYVMDSEAPEIGFAP